MICGSRGYTGRPSLDQRSKYPNTLICFSTLTGELWWQNGHCKEISVWKYIIIICTHLNMIHRMHLYHNSQIPCPQQDHSTRPSGDAPMNGCWTLMKKPQFDTLWFWCDSVLFLCTFYVGIPMQLQLSWNKMPLEASAHYPAQEGVSWIIVTNALKLEAVTLPVRKWNHSRDVAWLLVFF